MDSEHGEGGGHQDGTDDGRVDVRTIKPGQFVVGSFFGDNTCEICPRRLEASDAVTRGRPPRARPRRAHGRHGVDTPRRPPMP